MKSLYTILLLIAIVPNQVVHGQTPSFAWAKQLSGTVLNSQATGFSIATDANGNIYTTGRFSGTIDFDPGAGTTALTAVAFSDIFVLKLDANGNLLWVNAIGSDGGDEGRSLALDAAGNVYVTGVFYNTADFDGGPGVQNLSPTGGGPNNQETFILKLDTNGNYQWAKNIGASSSIEAAEGIAASATGDVAITGFFSFTVDFDPGAGVHNVSSGGGADAYVLRLDTNGNFVSVSTFENPASATGMSVAFDGSGNTYTGGYFSGTADFDPSAGVQSITSAGSDDYFIVKLNAAGNFVWAKALGGTLQDRITEIAVDVNGNVLFTGTFLGTADFDPGAGTNNLISAGGGDIVVGKLDTNGNALWASRIGSTNTDIGQSIATDATGNVYVTGGFWGNPDFDPGAGIFELLTSGETDVFILKLNPSGNFLWAASMGYISGEDDTGFGIDAGSDGSIFTTGNFVGTTDFDPGSCVFNLSNALRSAFIHKMNPTSTALHTISSFNPTSGPVGTTVTITGTNFSTTPANNIVAFNGIAATVTASTVTTITTSVPAGATTGPITVTIGCDEATSSSDFTVSASGGITFNTQPSNKTICSGANTTFTVSATGDTGLQYQWQRNGSDLSNNATYGGVTTNTLTITNAGASLNGALYRCVVSGDNSSDTPSSTATLVVNTTPSSPSIQPIDLGCGPASTTLEPDGAVSGQSYNYYDAPSDGSLLDDGPTYSTGLLSNTVSFYISVYNTTTLCESDRTPVMVTVLFCNPPAINETLLATMIEGIATINLEEIISDPDDNLDLTTLSITEQPSSGAVASLEDNILTLDYAGLPEVSSDHLRIRVCDLTSICTEAELNIELTGDLIIYNGISPNDDEQNDTWQIVNINLFSSTKKNKVTVFNRWGDIVFDVADYDNNQKVFKGLNNHGGKLPSGTYYYKIEFSSGLTTKTGYLVLKQ
jgi:gliding motility-associated-like protein